MLNICLSKSTDRVEINYAIDINMSYQFNIIQCVRKATYIFYELAQFFIVNGTPQISALKYSKFNFLADNIYGVPIHKCNSLADINEYWTLCQLFVTPLCNPSPTWKTQIETETFPKNVSFGYHEARRMWCLTVYNGMRALFWPPCRFLDIYKNIIKRLL